MKTYFYEEIDSTNTEAKRLIDQGLQETALLVARHQTAGRGRQGKSFYSPSDSGIYMTVVLHPKCRIDAAVTLTTTVACIVADAIERVYGICPGIKWVNDLYLNDKKICGILCEAVNDYKKMQLQSVIIGIGINMSTSEYPEDIKEIAGALLGSNQKAVDNNSNFDIDGAMTDNVNKSEKNSMFNDLNCHNYRYSKLVSEIAIVLKEKIPADFVDFIDFYKSHSICLNKEIYFMENDIKTYGIAVDVDSEGGLVVELESGEHRILRSGEISVRLK